MLYARMIKTVLLFLTLGTALLFASNSKKFDVESGIVSYSIKGDGKLTNDVNLTIKGEAKLHFKDAGVVAFVEENYEELTTGVIHDLNKVQLCNKFEDKQRFDVDFPTKKIFERAMPKGNFKDYFLKNMVKTGEEKIAGYTCEVWEGDGIRKCLYKGVPLLLEHYILGVYYEKRAVKAKFDIETDPSNFVLPDFPVEKFALFKSNIKTKSIKLPKEMTEVILTVAKKMHNDLKNSKTLEDDLTEQQKLLYVNMLGQNIFEKQKKFLPILLKSMKKSRLCLQRVDNVAEANICLVELLSIKKSMTNDVDNSIESWKYEDKHIVLDSFDENIYLLESKMKCIRSAQNLANLSDCMK